MPLIAERIIRNGPSNWRPLKEMKRESLSKNSQNFSRICFSVPEMYVRAFVFSTLSSVCPGISYSAHERPSPMLMTPIATIFPRNGESPPGPPRLLGVALGEAFDHVLANVGVELFPRSADGLDVDDEFFHVGFGPVAIVAQQERGVNESTRVWNTAASNLP